MAERKRRSLFKAVDLPGVKKILGVRMIDKGILACTDKGVFKISDMGRKAELIKPHASR